MSPPPDDRRRRATPDATAGSLSPNLRYVCERAWRLGYGTFRGLHVRAGDPLLDPPPTVVHTFRCDAATTTKHEAPIPDFVIKREHLAFQQTLAAIGDGVIDVVKVHDHIPVVLEMGEQF
jgi:hypothetical protein